MGESAQALHFLPFALLSGALVVIIVVLALAVLGREVLGLILPRLALLAGVHRAGLWWVRTGEGKEERHEQGRDAKDVMRQNLANNVYVRTRRGRNDMCGRGRGRKGDMSNAVM